MCQHNSKDYSWIYSNDISQHMIHLIKNGDEDLDDNIDNDIADYLLKMFGPGVTIASLSPVLVNYIYRMFQKKNVLKNSRNKFTSTSSSNSCYNFSVAKIGVFLANIKQLKSQKADISILKNYSNLVLSSQTNVEIEHVGHISEQSSTMLDADNTTLLHYVSKHDSKVRHEHAQMNGTIIPKNDPFCETMLHLLSDFNCRCEVIEESDATKYNEKGKAHNYSQAVKTSVSDIDLKSGKAGLFKETLPAFENAPVVVRKYYRKLSDSIYE